MKNKKNLYYSYLIKDILNVKDIQKKLKKKSQILKYNKKNQNKNCKNFASCIKLISKENEVFFINKKAAKKSQLLKDCMDDDENFKELNLVDVNSKYLKLIIEFLEHYKDSEPKIPEKPLNDRFEKSDDEWTKKFFSKLDSNDIFELLLGSNYMNIQCLIELCSAHMADSIKNKTPEEIRKTFNISNDLTEEEKKQIIAENQWIND